MRQILHDAISWVFGIGGFSIAWIQVHVPDILLKVVIVLASAFISGYLGHIGKLVAVWSIRKIKTFFRNIKKSKDESIS